MERLGISRSYASELLKRIKTPSLEVAVRVEQEFGVPAAAWLELTVSEQPALSSVWVDGPSLDAGELAANEEEPPPPPLHGRSSGAA